LVRPETFESPHRLSRLEPFEFLLFALLVPFLRQIRVLFVKLVSPSAFPLSAFCFLLSAFPLCCHSVATLLPVLLPLKRLTYNDVTDVATFGSAITFYLL
jgi:hypothetical protein